MRQLAVLAVLAAGACSTTRDYAPAPSVQPGAYRAAGTNPIWELTVDRANIVFTDQSNRVRIAQPTPPGASATPGTPIRTARLQVLISQQRCTDDLTRQVYPQTVQVTADGRNFRGCSGDPFTTSLANSNWIVTDVSGRGTGGGPLFTMQFAANRMSARFGCNVLNGTYAVTSITLSASARPATMTACADPSFEQQALAVLAQPATLLWSSADQVTIGNDKGQIKLRRGV